jgi:uncharacterized membrane protein
MAIGRTPLATATAAASAAGVSAAIRRSAGVAATDAPSRSRRAGRIADLPTLGPSGPPAAITEHVAVIKAWEQAQLDQRSRAQRIGMWLTRSLSGGWAITIHLVVFTGWIAMNNGVVPGVTAFDRFPYPLLTTSVSLEAIVLSLLVLSTQNHLSIQADRRAHLDLQIDLLVEREMTAVLAILRSMQRHLNIDVSVPEAQLQELVAQTDVASIAELTAELSPGPDDAAQRGDEGANR